MHADEEKGNNYLIPKSWLSEESQREFQNKVVELYPNINSIDWKINPSLIPGVSDGEDALKWDYKFSAKIGRAGYTVADYSDFGEGLSSVFENYSKVVGKNLVRIFSDAIAMPWENLVFCASFYKGHQTWEKLNYSFTTEDWVTGYSYALPQQRERKIVGVLQVQNAELMISSVIKNFLPLVDWLIVLENDSSDSTLKKIQELASLNKKLITRNILCTEAGGRFLHSLCGTDTVVVRVDADEVWNPSFVPHLRNTLLEQDFGPLFRVNLKDCFLNVSSIDQQKETCRGMLKDFSNSIFYFGNILAWPQPSERLHGDLMVIRGSDDKELKPIKISVSSPAILHFPFLNLTAAKKPSAKPGWNEHKKGYLTTQEAEIDCGISDFHIKNCLQSILKSDTWRVSR